MFTFEGVPFIISGIVSLILGVVLLTLHVKHCVVDRSYRRVKVTLSLTAFIYAFTDFCILEFINHNMNCFILDDCLIPILFYVQVSLITFAMLDILHSKLADSRNLFLCLTIPIVLGLVYLLLFSISGKDTFFSEDGYTFFSNSEVAYSICLIIYAIVISSFPICIALLLSAVVSYNNKLNCYFSGKNVEDGQRWCILVYGVIIYFILSALDLIVSDFTLDPVITLLSTIAFALLVFVIFKMQSQHKAIAPIEKITVESYDLVPESDNHSISTIVRSWEWRKDKPFLKEDITVEDVANQMEIDTQQLSNYINSVYNLNFNSWINNMRINEVNRLLVSQKQMSISDIALRTGFTDQTILERTFKRTLGITPSAYREENLQLRHNFPQKG